MIRFSALNIDQLAQVLAIDEYSYNHPERKEQIIRAIEEHTAYIIIDDKSLVGYAIFRAHGFLEEPFICLVVIGKQFRSKGYAKKLMLYLETISFSKRVHASTNTSNIPMRNLLQSLGYTQDGVITSIEPNDPEIFYYKNL